MFIIFKRILNKIYFIKVEIEAEFARYKLARKLQAKKAKEEAEGNGGGGDEEHEEGGIF